MNNFHEPNANKRPSSTVPTSTIDLGRLDNVRQDEDKTTAACPACRELGRDTKGNHLVIFRGGQFACVLFPGAATDSKQHRQRILQLVGRPTARRQFNVPSFPAEISPAAPPALLGGIVLDPPARTFIRADGDLEELTASLTTACPREIALAAEGLADGGLDLLALYAPPATRYPTIIEVGRLGPLVAANLLEQLIGKTVVVHGAQAALRLLARWQPGLRLEQIDWSCTWIAAKLLSNGTDLGCDLDPVLKRYLSMSIARQGKDAADNPGVPGEMCHSRVADSVRHLFALKQRMVGDMTDMRVEKVFTLENSLLPVTHDLNQNGWQIDLATLHAERARLIAALDAATPGEEGPLRSRITQIDGWLRQLSPDGRLRCTYEALGAATGRFSASNPNLQNVPRGRLRAAFCAMEGRKLVIGDLSQIQLRILALITGDQAMLDAFRRGEDLHRLTASAVLEKAPAEIDGQDRQLGKVTNFGLIYGQGSAGFVTYAQNLGVDLTLEKAVQIRNRFFSTYPGIAGWHRRAWRLPHSFGRSAGTTVLGRRRFLPRDANNWEWFQARTNHLIQGSEADLFKTALVELHPQLETYDARLIGMVHDEVIVEVPTAATEPVTQVLEQTFEGVFVHLFDGFSKFHFGRSLEDLFQDHPACEVKTYVCANWAAKG